MDNTRSLLCGKRLEEEAVGWAARMPMNVGAFISVELTDLHLHQSPVFVTGDDLLACKRVNIFAVILVAFLFCSVVE